MLLGSDPDAIGRYEIAGLLARGGKGRLYLARDPKTSQLVIVKLLNATFDSGDFRERFDREARALAALSHPNIVHIYDYGDFHDAPFIVMEYVVGETLEEKIARRAKLSVSQKLRWLVDVCAGLAHAHASDLIHRDVRPANLIVDQEDRLKILDFGIARVSDSSLASVHTREGMTRPQIGTPGYMSPEQTQARELDRRADVFSVGAVAYELFAYRAAFPGATASEIESRIMRTPPEPLAMSLPGFDHEVDAVVSQALARDPALRHQNATELGSAFERCRVRLSATEAPLPVRRLTPPTVQIGRSSAAARADSAYQRGLTAYQENAPEAARRCLIEALAEDPAHADARTLLARLEPDAPPAAVRRPMRQGGHAAAATPLPAPAAGTRGYGATMGTGRGSEAVSVDPTVLISRASLSREPDAIEKTVLIRREDLDLGSPSPDQTIVNSPRSETRRPPVEPVGSIAARKREPQTTSRKSFGLGLALRSFLERLKARRSPPQVAPRRPSPRPVPAPRSVRASSRALGFWNHPLTRGSLMVLAGLAAAALVVFGAVRGARWLWPPGQLLTLNKPVGGTLVGPGLECGTGGTDCSTTRPDNEAVELSARPDSGYVFSGFMGDCAPVGRTTMSGPRTCGATFDPVPVATAPVTWPLTISKPTGGTIVAAGDIVCGTLGDHCAINLPDGVPVTFHQQPDPNFTFVSFTNDCAPDGETTMSAARTCGATFAASAAAVRVVETPRPDTPRGSPRVTVGSSSPSGTRPPPGDKVAEVKSDGAVQTPPVAPNVPQPQAASPPPIVTTPTVPTATNVAPPPITPEQHAKDEISILIKNFCAEYQTLKTSGMKKLFPRVDERSLQDQFRQFRSLKCSVKLPPDYERLDAGAAGGAQVKFEMKQVIQAKSGGAPKINETIVTMVVSRMNFQSPWLIDRIQAEPKPAP